MKVAYLTSGHAVHDEVFTEAIRGAGHEVAVTRVPRPTSSADHRPRAVVEGALRAKPDIVHAGPIQAVAALVADLGGSPLVTASWGFDLIADTAHAAGRERAAWALERSSVLIVDCVAAREVASRLGMDRDRIVTLPWGVDLQRFKGDRPGSAQTSGREDRDDRPIVLLTARQHEPIYGVDVVIEAFVMAAARQPRLELVVIGEGSLTSVLEARIASAGLVDRVQFVGPVPHETLPDWMAAADLYVSGSHVDGSSVTLLEAMASGLPAIVSNIVGNREWVEDGQSGAWFADGDADALAACLVEFSSMPRTRLAEFGALGRRIVEARADWHANLSRLWDAYRMAAAAP